MNSVKLNNGIEMPQMGYGVYQIVPDACERHVAEALSAGYRMIDTAQAYHNEEGVGRAVADSGVKRDEIFLVSKVWISNYGYDKAKASVDESLRRRVLPAEGGSEGDAGIRHKDDVVGTAG